jgi:hypothetical protein
MNKWKPIDTAPEDEDILVWFDHDRDKTVGAIDRSSRTDYAENVEYGDHASGSGIVVARYVGPYIMSEEDWASGNRETIDIQIPGCWVAKTGDEYRNVVCNALFWMPLPKENPFDEENV